MGFSGVSNINYSNYTKFCEILSLTANKRTVRSALTFCKSYLSCLVGTGGMVEVVPSFPSTAGDKFTWIPLHLYSQMRRLTSLLHKPMYSFLLCICITLFVQASCFCIRQIDVWVNKPPHLLFWMLGLIFRNLYTF